MNSNSLLSPHSCCTQLLLDAKRSLMVVTHRSPAVLWCLPPFIWIKALGGNARTQWDFPAESSRRCDLSTATLANTTRVGEGCSAHRTRNMNINISVWAGCSIQLPKCDMLHKRCRRLSIGSPCYKGASLPWPTILMQTLLNPLHADPLHLRHLWASLSPRHPENQLKQATNSKQTLL